MIGIERMRPLAIAGIFLASILFVTEPIQAAAPTLQQLAIATEEAYSTRNLGKLDSGRPVSKVRVTIEHSLGEDQNRFVTQEFQTLAAAEQWLRSRERGDQMPVRAGKPLLNCRKRICTYNFKSGILHNHLYLKKITYGYSNGRPYIKSLYLLDGD
jgi:hypothetical protein